MMVAKELSVWLNITRIPVHAWKEEVFKGLLSMMGNFVYLDECTRKRSRLGVGKVLATTNVIETINRALQVKINGTIFSIRIMEEGFQVFWRQQKYAPIWFRLQINSWVRFHGGCHHGSSRYGGFRRSRASKDIPR